MLPYSGNSFVNASKDKSAAVSFMSIDPVGTVEVILIAGNKARIQQCGKRPRRMISVEGSL